MDVIFLEGFINIILEYFMYLFTLYIDFFMFRSILSYSLIIRIFFFYPLCIAHNTIVISVTSLLYARIFFNIDCLFTVLINYDMYDVYFNDFSVMSCNYDRIIYGLKQSEHKIVTYA